MTDRLDISTVAAGDTISFTWEPKEDKVETRTLIVSRVRGSTIFGHLQDKKGQPAKTEYCISPHNNAHNKQEPDGFVISRNMTYWGIWKVFHAPKQAAPTKPRYRLGLDGSLTPLDRPA